MSKLDICSLPATYSDASLSVARNSFVNTEWQHGVTQTASMLPPKRYPFVTKSLDTLPDWMEWTLNKPYRDRVQGLYKPFPAPHRRGAEVCDGWILLAGKENDMSPAKRPRYNVPSALQNGGGVVEVSHVANGSVRSSRATSARCATRPRPQPEARRAATSGGCAYNKILFEQRKQYAEVLTKCLRERTHFTRTTCRLASFLQEEVSPVRNKAHAPHKVIRKETLDTPDTCGLQQRLCLVSQGREKQRNVPTQLYHKTRLFHEVKMLDSPDWMGDLKQLLEEFHKVRTDRERREGRVPGCWHRAATGMPKLTDAMEQEVDAALAASPGDEVLVQAFNQKIKRSDIGTLAGLNWLNDEVINFFMNMLMQRSQEDTKYPKVYAFNTFFYPRLESGGHAAVRRWTKKVDIFSYDLLLVPLHFHAHWCLAVVDLRKGHLSYYDSMGSDSDLQTLDTIKEYLQDECRDKQKRELDTSLWTSAVVRDIPLQMNGSDCGMFLCRYAECLSRGVRISFTQQHMPYFRRRMVYEILHQSVLS